MKLTDIMHRLGLLLLAAIIIPALVGCGTIGRTDGGESAVFAATGKQTTGPSISLLGGMVKLNTWRKWDNVTATVDEPVGAVGGSALSKAAAEAIQAESMRDTNGMKRITYGAQGISTDAQKLDSILHELERIKNGVPGIPNPQP